MNDGDSEHLGVRRSRRLLRATAHIDIADRSWDAELIDLSLTGGRFRKPAGFAASDGVPLKLQIRCGASLSPMLSGRLVRGSEDSIAIHFEHLGARDERELEEFIQGNGSLADPIDH